MSAESTSQWHESVANWASSAWSKFRGWPVWLQIILWVLGWWLLIPILSWRSGLPVGLRAVVTALSLGTFLILAISNSQEATSPPGQTGPARQLESAILKKLGKSNRDGVQRLQVHAANPGLEIVLTWAINENLTENMTKKGARLETTKILEVIGNFTAVDYVGARFEGTFALVGKYGSSSEERVFLGTYSRETIHRINFDNFNFENAWDITDGRPFIHPSSIPLVTCGVAI